MDTNYAQIVIMILNFVIVGSFVSILMQFLRSRFNIGENASKLLLLTISLIISAVVVLLVNTAIWPTLVAILGGASTAYGIFVKDSLPVDTTTTPIDTATQ